MTATQTCSCGYPRLGCLGKMHPSSCKTDCPHLAELQTDAFVLREIAQCSALAEGQKEFLLRLAARSHTDAPVKLFNEEGEHVADTYRDRAHFTATVEVKK